MSTGKRVPSFLKTSYLFWSFKSREILPSTIHTLLVTCSSHQESRVQQSTVYILSRPESVTYWDPRGMSFSLLLFVCRGKHYSVNVPLKNGMTDEAYSALFRPILAKVMQVYQPEAIVFQSGKCMVTHLSYLYLLTSRDVLTLDLKPSFPQIPPPLLGWSCILASGWDPAYLCDIAQPRLIHLLYISAHSECSWESVMCFHLQAAAGAHISTLSSGNDRVPTKVCWLELTWMAKWLAR